MKKFYCDQGEKGIYIKFIICGLFYCTITDYIQWYKINSFLSNINYYDKVYSKYKKESKEENRFLEVKKKESKEMEDHIDEKKSGIDKDKLQDMNSLYYEESICENHPYEKIIEVKKIEESSKECNQIYKLGCEVDIPIDKIVAFIHKST